jgi:hypothetical protein
MDANRRICSIVHRHLCLSIHPKSLLVLQLISAALQVISTWSVTAMCCNHLLYHEILCHRIIITAGPYHPQAQPYQVNSINHTLRTRHPLQSPYSTLKAHRHPYQVHGPSQMFHCTLFLLLQTFWMKKLPIRCPRRSSFPRRHRHVLRTQSCSASTPKYTIGLGRSLLHCPRSYFWMPSDYEPSKRTYLPENLQSETRWRA